MERQWRHLKQLHGELGQESERGARDMWALATASSSPLLSRAGLCQGLATSCLHCHQLLLLSCLARLLSITPCPLPAPPHNSLALMSVLVQCLERAVDPHVLSLTRKCLALTASILPAQITPLVMQMLEAVKRCHHTNSDGHATASVNATNNSHQADNSDHVIENCQAHRCGSADNSLETDKCGGTNERNQTDSCNHMDDSCQMDSFGHTPVCHCVWHVEVCHDLLSSHVSLGVRHQAFRVVSIFLPLLAELCLPDSALLCMANPHPSVPPSHPSVPPSHPSVPSSHPKPPCPSQQLTLSFLGLLLKLVKESSMSEESKGDDAGCEEGDKEEEMEIYSALDLAFVDAGFTLTEVSDGDTSIHSCLEKLVTLLKSFGTTGNLQCRRVQCRKILEILSARFCYGGWLSLVGEIPEDRVRLAQYLCDCGLFSQSLLSALPLFQRQASFGGWQCPPSHSSSVAPDLSMLSILSLLCLKVCAVLSRSLTTSHVMGVLTSMDGCVSSALQLSGQTVSSWNWLELVLGNQDNFYIEALLCLLDISLCSRRIGEIAGSERQGEEGCGLPDPHCHFLSLLAWCRHSASLLVDWLASPETCFLLYITRYLKCLLAQWPSFLISAHRHHEGLCSCLSKPCHQKEKSLSPEGVIPGCCQTPGCADGSKDWSTSVNSGALAAQTKPLVDYSSSSDSEDEGMIETQEEENSGRTEEVEEEKRKMERQTIVKGFSMRHTAPVWNSQRSVAPALDFTNTVTNVWTAAETQSGTCAGSSTAVCREMHTNSNSTVCREMHADSNMAVCREMRADSNTAVCREMHADSNTAVCASALHAGALGRSCTARGCREQQQAGPCCGEGQPRKDRRVRTENCSWQCLERPRDTLEELCRSLERLSQQGLFPYQPRPLLRLLHQCLQRFRSTVQSPCNV